MSSAPVDLQLCILYKQPLRLSLVHTLSLPTHSFLSFARMYLLRNLLFPILSLWPPRVANKVRRKVWTKFHILWTFLTVFKSEKSFARLLLLLFNIWKHCWNRDAVAENLRSLTENCQLFHSGNFTVNHYSKFKNCSAKSDYRIISTYILYTLCHFWYLVCVLQNKRFVWVFSGHW